jgi:hypothetical protein
MVYFTGAGEDLILVRFSFLGDVPFRQLLLLFAAVAPLLGTDLDSDAHAQGTKVDDFDDGYHKFTQSENKFWA